MLRGGVGAVERSIFLTLVLITGDDEPRQLTLSTAAEEVVEMVDAGTLAGLPHHLTEGAQHELSIDELSSSAASMRETFGRSLAVDFLAWENRGATFEVTAEHGRWQLTLEVTEAGQIDHIVFEPGVARSAPLGLPVRGQWKVSNGGASSVMNYHVPYGAQRRAADLVAVDSNNQTHSGEGTRNEDYYAYGRDVVAVDDGIVSVVVNGVKENLPGHGQRAYTSGNMVFLEHSGGLYTKYSHLIPGSIMVEPGQHVQRGQVLGRCGNSGNSSAPHLHVHGQDKPLGHDAWGIELVFEDVHVIRDEQHMRVSNYEFLGGDIISPE